MVSSLLTHICITRPQWVKAVCTECVLLKLLHVYNHCYRCVCGCKCHDNCHYRYHYYHYCSPVYDGYRHDHQSHQRFVIIFITIAFIIAIKFIVIGVISSIVSI